ncbi:MAG TPA: hemolysin family protein [Polyangiaceae bacterium]|nr:hemolysin family protein [Polyangiaceae bacterium]
MLLARNRALRAAGTRVRGLTGPMLPLLVIVALTLANAVYVAAEFAAVAVPRSQVARLAEGGDRRAASLLGLLRDGERLDRYIAACQIGITFTSLIAGAYGQATLGVRLQPWAAQLFAIEPETARTVSVLTVLFALTALQVTVGELVPKSLALQFPLRTALLTYAPVRWSARLYAAFIVLLNGSGHLILRALGMPESRHQHVHSPEEIELLLGEARSSGQLDSAAHRRLQQGLRLSSRSVHQLMVPRSQVVAIDIDTPPAELIGILLSSPYNHLPVYQRSLDEVLGTVSVKEVVGAYARRGALPPLRELVKPLPFVPSNLVAERLIRFLHEHKSSKAFVLDEFGGVEGMVSIEDVLIELFGDVGDELKPSDPPPEELADGRVRVPGDMSLSDAERWTGVTWKGKSSTIGGLITEVLERLPQAGERVAIGDIEVEVLEMAPTAVRWVAILPSPQARALERPSA